MNQRRERGSVAVMIGLALPVLIGMVALGTEVTFLLFKQRQMQSTADAAALGGATALQSGHPTPTVEARGIAGYLGFIDGTGGATVTVNNPPLTGPQAGSSGAVEVIVAQPQILNLAKLFSSGTFAVSARSVAITGSGSYCVLQLGSGTDFIMSNGAVANLTQCGLAVNRGGSSALTMTGAAVLNAQSVSVVGGASISNGAGVNPSNAVKTGQPIVPDPYAGVTMPASSGCNFTSKSYGHGTWVMSPSVYCKGVAFTNDATVTMNPGVYFIDRGSFDVGGAVRLTGAGVTIVLTSSTGSSYATSVIGNGAQVTLSAPTTGATAGIIFFGDRRAPAGNTTDFGGGAALNLSGTIYLPSQQLIFQNGISNASTCTELIAGTIVLKGGSKIQVNCPAGVAAIGATNASLVE